MSKGDFYSGYEVAMLYKVIANFSDLFFPYIIVIPIVQMQKNTLKC